jgi:hypothetical protein
MEDATIKRVAKALYDALKSEPDKDQHGRFMGTYVTLNGGTDEDGNVLPDGLDRVCIDGDFNLLRLARAAIEAMRDSIVPPNVAVSREFTRTFDALISAALADKQG